jgi:predicted homoserine dehydrogenase-like protein
MNLYRLLRQRAATTGPIRIGLIGAGKFGTMFLAQARLTPGLHILGIADLNLGRARTSCSHAGWSAEEFSVPSFDEARKNGGTHITDDALALIAADGLDVVVEATGIPQAGIKHARAAIAHKRHVIMVCVEADALARKALPLGLASDVKVVRPVARGQVVTWSDVAIDPSDATVRFRRQMEAAFPLPYSQ